MNNKPVRNFFHSILNKINLDGLLLLFFNSALKHKGWFKSFREKKSIDNNGNPIPWFTYSFLDFITKKLNFDMNIFEFGSGNSTLFFSKKVKSVTSVEHNLKWYNQINFKKDSNIRIIYKELEIDSEYSKSVNDDKIKYDIIIIDGEDRNNCIYNSLTALNKGGVIVLDDSEREEYNSAIKFLIKNNFKRIDFWGMAPGVLFNKCTTVFYKTDNCFNI